MALICFIVVLATIWIINVLFREAFFFDPDAKSSVVVSITDKRLTLDTGKSKYELSYDLSPDYSYQIAHNNYATPNDLSMHEDLLTSKPIETSCQKLSASFGSVSKYLNRCGTIILLANKNDESDERFVISFLFASLTSCGLYVEYPMVKELDINGARCAQIDGLSVASELKYFAPAPWIFDANDTWTILATSNKAAWIWSSNICFNNHPVNSGLTNICVFMEYSYIKSDKTPDLESPDYFEKIFRNLRVN
jgi:hypothetical protein